MHKTPLCGPYASLFAIFVQIATFLVRFLHILIYSIKKPALGAGFFVAPCVSTGHYIITKGRGVKPAA
jgi:hypothetical protein